MVVMLSFLFWSRGPGAVAFPWAPLKGAESHSCCWPTDWPMTQLEMRCFLIPW